MEFSNSLRKNKEFQYVYNKGNSVANKYLIMYILNNDLNVNRIGISVSKKVGNSVIRHRLTRLIRESYRLTERNYKCGYDIVVIARPTAKDKSFSEINSALNHLAKLQKVMK